MEILLTDILTGLTGKTWEINKCGNGCLANKPYDLGVLGRTSGRAKSVYRPSWKKSFAESGKYMHVYERQWHKALIQPDRLLFKYAHSRLVLVGKEVDFSVPT